MRTTMSYASKIATNGQVVVPKELRDLLCLQAGEFVVFTVNNDKSTGLSVTISKRATQFTELVGVLNCATRQSGRPD